MLQLSYLNREVERVSHFIFWLRLSYLVLRLSYLNREVKMFDSIIIIDNSAVTIYFAAKLSCNLENFPATRSDTQPFVFLYLSFFIILDNSTVSLLHCLYNSAVTIYIAAKLSRNLENFPAKQWETQPFTFLSRIFFPIYLLLHLIIYTSHPLFLTTWPLFLTLTDSFSEMLKSYSPLLIGWIS